MGNGPEESLTAKPGSAPLSNARTRRSITEGLTCRSRTRRARGAWQDHRVTTRGPSEMEIRFYDDPDTGLPHIYGHGVTEDEGWQALRSRGEDLPGRRDSRIKLGQTAAG